MFVALPALFWRVFAVLVGLLILAVIVGNGIVIPIGLIVIGGVVYYRRRRRREAMERVRREEDEQWEANRQTWRELTFEPGNYAVVVSGFTNDWAADEVTDFLCDVPGLRDQPAEEVAALVERVVHISPQTVAEGIAQGNAIHLKEALERRGAKVKIKEGALRTTNGSRRESISAKVRNEVWRRDEGRCVDCGSRDKLEYDHIIAVANGGSNTARNIELRCEPCNRKKGAKV
jgi:HNH endonuclease